MLKRLTQSHGATKPGVRGLLRCGGSALVALWLCESLITLITCEGFPMAAICSPIPQTGFKQHEVAKPHNLYDRSATAIVVA